MKISNLPFFTANKIQYVLRLVLGMIGVVMPCWYLDTPEFLTPLILGVIASAVAETDDNLSGRLSALLISLVCFIIATFSVEILFHTPALFIFGLVASSFAFTMLGAISSRYATIAFASLLIAVYTMLGAEQSSDLWTQPILLLAGATWYGFLSLLWLFIWPMQPVQQSVSQLFIALGAYLEQKSDMFHSSLTVKEAELKLKDANANAKLVSALNVAKHALLNHIRGKQLNASSRRFLKIYFIAQDIHERANSSHYRYEELSAAFFHSDIMFRLQHIIKLQAKACQEVGRSLNKETSDASNQERKQALDELRMSLDYIKTHSDEKNAALVDQLSFLFKNLATIERQLLNIGDTNTPAVMEETDVFDPYAFTLREKLERVRTQLSPKSMLFRHAVRLSLTLALGYVLIQAMDLPNGYWILLTILFVCQPNYSATRNRLKQRILGTTAGLLSGLLLLMLFPDLTGQLVLMTLFGTLFFIFRASHYAAATAFMTLFVVVCFNQQGAGFAVIMPRLFDTMVGCLLSVFAVRYIFPDWQAHRLRGVMTDAIAANRDYLAQIIGQYRIGKKDNFNYRLARREAHNQDAQLSAAISNMLIEPGRYQTAIDESFRFLCLNHSMLNYISTLGAHRKQISEDSIYEFIAKSHREIHRHLEHLISQLNDDEGKKVTWQPDLSTDIAAWQHNKDKAIGLIFQQLHLIQQVLPELEDLTSQLAKIAIKK